MAEPALATPPPALEIGTPATSRRRLFADHGARWLVTGGGLAIIASILGILVFILIEVGPLMRRARVTPGEPLAVAAPSIGALLGNEHRTHLVTLGADGVVRAFTVFGGEPILSRPLLPPAEAATDAAAPTPGPRFLEVQAQPGGFQIAAATSDGRAAIVRVNFPIRFDAQQRRVEPTIDEPVWLELDPAGGPLGQVTGRLSDDGTATAAAALADGSLAVARHQSQTNAFTGEVTASSAHATVEVDGSLRALVLDQPQANLYGGTAEGHLLWWRLDEEGKPVLAAQARAGAAVTSMTMLLGDQALVVGQQDGSLSVWFRTTGSEGDGLVLTRVRDFPAHPGPITLLASSLRDKGFVAQDASGRLGLYYSTSHRTLWTGPSPLPRATALAFSPKADALFLGGPGQFAEVAIDNPHPQVSWQVLFGKVWFERADEPAYAWQSTGGTDDFEPKLSLTPLLLGTLKGTIYSLLLAIPLGIFGAMYTSQFMHPSLARYVKPTVEIMAALPSVVLGFLAGLWLAPRLEQYFPALILALVLLPLFVLAAGAGWRALPRRFRGRFPAGFEALVFVVVVALGLWVSVALSRPVEVLVFGGNFQSWLLATFGLPYDQRNAVVIGLAMGFAVIPIIFAISEDAFSNVPRNLVAGSLALGADRWQTVTRVVLPTASPGIFSAIMVGFGRAVGETMIVLMATGNTPIMSWNPFNGFRTLSANIAVEIPEAPHSGTLYRVLFLAALLLFILTFVVNTAAELVRQRLRRKFAQL